MKTTYTLSKKTRPDGSSEIMVRFIGTAMEIFRGKTNLYINVDLWDQSSGMPRTNMRTPQLRSECRHIATKLTNLDTKLQDSYASSRNHSKEWLKDKLASMQWNGDDPILSKHTELALMRLDDAMMLMVEEKTREHLIGYGTIKFYSIITHKLTRYCDMTGKRICDMDDDGIESVVRYFREEMKRGRECSDNYISSTCKSFGRLLNWVRKKDRTIAIGDMPKIRQLTYGTPFYIGKETRDALYDAVMPRRELEEARDMFILQCYIGCRYSDLISFTYSNIHNGTISYIATKTIGREPTTISVPLHKVATDIIDKYKGMNGEYLTPRVNITAMNNRLKQVFRHCPQADISVTIRDMHSGHQRIARLSEVASTHMARRTFVGILYEMGYRESDICALSGHKEGSISIRRYRKVTEEIKRNMIDAL